MISHELWQNRLGADPQIVGRNIRLDDVPFTVIGVAPADFTGTNPLRNDIWTPLPARKLLRPNDPSVQSWLTSPKSCCTPMAGRLAPGVTRAQAQAELAILIDQFRTQNQMGAQRPQIIAAGTSWMEGPRKKRQVVPMMLTLFFAVTLVLAAGVRQYRQPAAGQGGSAAAGDRGAAFARRQPASCRSPIAGREHAAGCGGGGLGPGNGDGSSSRGVSPSGGGSGFSCGT